MKPQHVALSKPAGFRSACLSAVFLGVVAATRPAVVRAGQGRASFQVGLRIVARQPAPRVSEQVLSATSLGDPPYPIRKDWVLTEQKSGNKLIVLETEF